MKGYLKAAMIGLGLFASTIGFLLLFMVMICRPVRTGPLPQYLGDLFLFAADLARDGLSQYPFTLAFHLILSTGFCVAAEYDDRRRHEKR
jgi:hypothetical protein